MLESGGHWEKHLEAAVKGVGGVAVHDHPSDFWFKKEKLLLTVYVDDLLLSGTTANHDKLWRELRKTIDLEEAEPLDRFLCCAHTQF